MVHAIFLQEKYSNTANQFLKLTLMIFLSRFYVDQNHLNGINVFRLIIKAFLAVTLIRFTWKIIVLTLFFSN